MRFRWCCGWWPWWWWRLQRVDARGRHSRADYESAAGRAEGPSDSASRSRSRSAVHRAAARTSDGRCVAAECRASARGDPSSGDGVGTRTQFRQRELRFCAPGILRESPRSGCRASPNSSRCGFGRGGRGRRHDCAPDLIFRATQDCVERGTVIVSESIFQTRWNVPNDVDVAAGGEPHRLLRSAGAPRRRLPRARSGLQHPHRAHRRQRRRAGHAGRLRRSWHAGPSVRGHDYRLR